ncbi:hypothetical protein BJY24_005568 [Nocardia transvalensis]|uniref:Uncharacterized protein n=1 Tax=Nocardia transvalensis TaxID=37333 RepID=A0A7W9PIC6_9NOCA|nr:hypothetical protein [Nocardia transvalensis]MBB5916656.1 hypothetical protein [Nocardia transvalensis]
MTSGFCADTTISWSTAEKATVQPLTYVGHFEGGAATAGRHHLRITDAGELGPTYAREAPVTAHGR